ncbi:glycosyltransferase family 2 protein [Bacteroidota bacterium]
MDLVSIVILNYNGRKHLQTFLPSVVKFSQDHPIIVADNNSTDGSIQFLQNQYPNIRIIQFEENHGFSKGYNLAIAQVNSEFCVLLNSDVEVTENWIKPILKMMESDPSIVAGQPKILSYSSRNQFEYAGAGGGFIDYLGYPFCRGRLFDSLEEDENQYNDVVPVFWASGACFFVRTEHFLESGGFDEDFFAHMEEIDLCWRMQLKGFSVWYCGESTVYHLGGGTLPKSNPQKTYLNFRNSLLLLIKNHRTSVLLYSLILRFLLDGLASLKFLVSESPKDAWAVMKAYLHILIHINRYHKKRRKYRGLRKGKFLEIYNSSIVWQHFFKGINKYRDLRINNTR